MIMIIIKKNINNNLYKNYDNHNISSDNCNYNYNNIIITLIVILTIMCLIDCDNDINNMKFGTLKI